MVLSFSMLANATAAAIEVVSINRDSGEMNLLSVNYLDIAILIHLIIDFFLSHLQYFISSWYYEEPVFKSFERKKLMSHLMFIQKMIRVEFSYL